MEAKRKEDGGLRQSHGCGDASECGVYRQTQWEDIQGSVEYQASKQRRGQFTVNCE